ncbi:phage holin family protein [Flavobacteriaceae bacterium Ap0902]|nr:phage holin family protein [Flavobacteriaceae bacterium Ap0902]
MNFIINLLSTAIAAFVLAEYLLSGVQIKNFGAAIIFALVLGLVNAFVKPLLTILTIPVTVITLGLFLLVINALMIQIASYFVSGINVDTFWWALLFSILLSLLSSLISGLLGAE